MENKELYTLEELEKICKVSYERGIEIGINKEKGRIANEIEPDKIHGYGVYITFEDWLEFYLKVYNKK